MRDDAVFVGIDGGGTRSRALALDRDGRERARSEGPAALVREGEAGEAVAVVASLVRDIAAPDRTVASLVVGLAGAGRPATRAAIRDALLARALGSAVEVVPDIDVAYHDAFGSGAGILLLSGTGSIALGRAGDGREARAGGWGSALGDEGSGWGLGREGLRAVVRAADGRGPATDLTEALLAAVKAPSPRDLIAWMDAARKRDVAALAPVVLAAASAGDAVAVALAEDAARQLVAAVDAVRRALEPWDGAPAVALAGGLLAGSGAFRSRVEGQLAALPVRVDPREVIPVRGAARLALAAALGGP
jgi:N-acetylglucosamine kinase-like BadF-type ATPase